MKPQQILMPESPKRQWAGHCGCDESCAFQFISDNMEIVDVRSKPDEKQAEESSAPLILHLLLMW
ncbi:hypothetical protein GN244_ATG02034 [Phytophthora infestans]|uniref:Uncharacterized protein n=1 Tax=Phytophthora infestans TaxID=4787 RepID=A0A833TFC3_PHYIN|nr:hypothetical protein GN244_ATG02034 [Phytophthora infestans]